MKKIKIGTLGIIIFVLVCYLFWSIRIEKDENSQKLTNKDKARKSSVIQNLEQQDTPLKEPKLEVTERQKNYGELNPEEKEWALSRGYLMPNQVDPKIHTKVSSDKYIENVERVGINLTILQRIKTQIIKKERKSKLLVEEIKKDRETNPAILADSNDNFTFRGYGDVHIQTAEQAYQHFAKYGRMSFSPDYPVKYIEDDDYYIFTDLYTKIGSPNDFTKGYAIVKKGGLIIRWNRDEVNK